MVDRAREISFVLSPLFKYLLGEAGLKAHNYKRMARTGFACLWAGDVLVRDNPERRRWGRGVESTNDPGRKVGTRLGVADLTRVNRIKQD